MDAQIHLRREGSRDLPMLVFRFGSPLRAIASAPFGGGIGLRAWAINAQVSANYGRRDPDRHVLELAAALSLTGTGVGMLTAVDVRSAQLASDTGVDVSATVGVAHPILAAAPDEPCPNDAIAGTINIVAFVPERLSDAALVNAVGTLTEAKTQALLDAGVHATGTATDAVCVLCPDAGPESAFGGPRSRWGSPLARATYRAVLAGACP